MNITLDKLDKIAVRITDKEYFEDCYSGKYMTSHMMNLFRRAPIFYKMAIDPANKPEETSSFKFGKAVHTYILEGPEVFNNRYVVSNGPVNEKTGKPYGETSQAYIKWAAEQKGTPIGIEDFNVVHDMQERVEDRIGVPWQIGHTEVVLRTDWRGVPCQAKIDLLSQTHGIVDLKSCNSLDDFVKNISEYGYDYQMAFYTKMCELNGLDVDKCTLLAVEKSRPYRTREFILTRKYLQPFIDILEVDLDQYKICKDGNVWPEGFDKPVIFAAPDEEAVK